MNEYPAGEYPGNQFNNHVGMGVIMSQSVRDGFAVDEEGVTIDGYHSLVPISRRSMYAGKAIIIVLSIIILGYLSFTLSERYPGQELFTLYAPLILVLMIVAYCLISPVIFYKRYRYRIDEDKIEIRKGVFTIRHILVPVERIHQVEISKGPINRAFGLADVLITTAGGTVVIEYLEDMVAEGIAANLNERIIAMLRARDR